MKKYKFLSQEKEFVKLLIANTINRFGDAVDAVAYMWLVYELTSSAAWSAFIFAINKLPNIFLQPFLGSWIEKRDKRKVMVTVDTIRGFIVVLLVALYLLKLLDVRLLIILTFFTSVVESFRIPAGMSFFQKVIKAENYKEGMALNSALNTMAELAGFFISGIIIGKFGCIVAIGVDGITFFLSALLIFAIKVLYDEAAAAKKNNLLSDFKMGLSYIKSNVAIRNFTLMAMFVNAILTPINTFLVPYVKEYLGGNSNLLSCLNICISVGVFLGAINSPKVLNKLGADMSIVTAGGVVASAYVLMAFLPHVHIALLAKCMSACVIMLFGLGIGIINTVLKTQIVSTVKNEYMSRVSAVFNACISTISPLSAWIFGLSVKYMQISRIYLICGIICMAIFCTVKLLNLNFGEEVYE